MSQKYYLKGLGIPQKESRKRHRNHTAQRNKEDSQGMALTLLPFFASAVVHSKPNIAFGHGLNVISEATKDIFWLNVVHRNSNVRISVSIFAKTTCLNEMSMSGEGPYGDNSSQ